MINVLIITSPEDSHAINIMLALERRGCHPVMWFTADFPNQQCHSFSFYNNELYWESEGTNFTIKNDHFDVVWFRRPKKPFVAKAIQSEDKQNAQKENLMLFNSFWEVIAQNAIWINPVKHAKAANSKLLQLQLAKQLGLIIPKTLVSNDPARIKDFIANLHSPVIYKTLHPLHWVEHDKLYLTYTNTVTLADLPYDEVLQSVVGIYQQRIPKAYEVRVTYFGDYYVAVRINSQANVRCRMDWRAVPTEMLEIERVTLPQCIDYKCQALMKALGLLFGCFDFIVTPENDYIFLEINEAGQFLWIEELNHEITMLEYFTNFLMTKGRNADVKNNTPIVLAHLRESAQLYFEHVTTVHQNTHILN